MATPRTGYFFLQIVRNNGIARGCGVFTRAPSCVPPRDVS